jgi:hypothetical protein
MTEQPPGDGPINVGRNKDGTFAPGHKFSPGKPKGARCKATLAAERLLSGDKDTKAICAKIISEAKAGAPWACTAWLRLVCPAPRGRPVEFDMPPIHSASDIPAALLALMAQVAAGQITPTEGMEVASVLDALRQSFEVDSLTREVAALRRRWNSLLRRWSTEGNPPSRFSQRLTVG